MKKILNDIQSKLSVNITDTKNISGGCISDAFILTTSGGSFFLKLNRSSPSDMFQKEASGLTELKKAAALRVPDVILYEPEYILLEHIPTGSKPKNFYEEFGAGFARLHRYTAPAFGFRHDNYIGSSPQSNIPNDEEKHNWTSYYLNRRLLFQFSLAEKNGYASAELRSGMHKLESKIESILEGSENSPSLLHGDLWGGNYLCSGNGEPCLIDPAVYYGNREADLAMTKLFGGFSPAFYEAYNEEFPLPDGWQHRENIYKLYHILNHLNLFGMGYHSQAVSLINYYI